MFVGFIFASVVMEENLPGFFLVLSLLLAFSVLVVSFVLFVVVGSNVFVLLLIILDPVFFTAGLFNMAQDSCSFGFLFIYILAREMIRKQIMIFIFLLWLGYTSHL